MEVLSEQEWHARREHHQQRVRRWIDPRLARRSKNEGHPIEDFLFEYYAYRPGKLLKWHPGIGVVLRGDTAGEYLYQKGYSEVADGITANASRLPPRRVEAIPWLRDMLFRSRERPGLFGCWGLHEWAMVYRTESIRHGQWPLRVTSRQISEIVESLGPRCTHYDAFRFFSAVARPLNKFQPTRLTAVALEQPGCLHANMDLYKWAFKLAPFTASELVADCFELATKIRALDIRRALTISQLLAICPSRSKRLKDAPNTNPSNGNSPFARRLSAIGWSPFAIRSSKKCRAAPLIARAAPQPSRRDDCLR